MKRGARYLAIQSECKTYITDKPCKFGHIALRETTTGRCLECRKIQANAIVSANRLAYNSHKRRWRANKLDILATKMREIRSNESLEKRIARLEKARIKQREWRLKNPDHENTKLVKARYRKENPDKVNAAGAKYRAIRLKRTPTWMDEFSNFIVEEAYSLAALRTQMSNSPWHVDHVLPLQGKYVSGLHVGFNLQVIPGTENIRKRNNFVPA